MACPFCRTSPRTAGLVLAAALLAGGPTARALVDDPLRSPACARALATLEAARSARADVARERAAAATACLGAATPPARTGRFAQPPLEVPPPAIVAPAPARPLPPPPRPPPPVAIERAPGAPLCDPGGCWVPGGDRLRHLPPAAVVPPGLCAPGPGLVYCP